MAMTPRHIVRIGRDLERAGDDPKKLADLVQRKMNDLALTIAFLPAPEDERVYLGRAVARELPKAVRGAIDGRRSCP